MRLDDVLGGEWLPRLAGRVGVVKIDVEGFEPSVLAGGLAFLRAVRPPWVMSEVSDRMMGAATGKKASDYFQEVRRGKEGRGQGGETGLHGSAASRPLCCQRGGAGAAWPGCESLG